MSNEFKNNNNNNKNVYYYAVIDDANKAHAVVAVSLAVVATVVKFALVVAVKVDKNSTIGSVSPAPLTPDRAHFKIIMLRANFKTAPTIKKPKTYKSQRIVRRAQLKRLRKQRITIAMSTNIYIYIILYRIAVECHRRRVS